MSVKLHQVPLRHPVKMILKKKERKKSLLLTVLEVGSWRAECQHGQVRAFSSCRLLAWRIPWTEEPGGLQSMGSHRVRHD